MLNIYQHLSTAPQPNLQDLFQQMALLSYPWQAQLGILPFGEMIVMRLGLLPLSVGPKQLKTTHLAQYQLALF